MSKISVKPILRTDKKKTNGKCPIYYLVIIDGKSLKLSADADELEENWIKAEGRIKGSKTSVKNSVLKRGVSDIEDFIWTLKASDSDLDLETVKSHFTKKGKGTTAFYELLDECYRLKFREIEPSTQKHYNLVRRRLSEFKSRIKFDDINLRFVERFEAYLISQGVGESGLWTHHKILKVIIRYAIKKKKIAFNPYEDFKVKKGEPKWGALNEAQVIAISYLEFENGVDGRGLDLSRDLFLFACYTGLRYQDVMRITNKNIINDSYINIKTKKTGSVTNIPLLEETKHLIAKYSCPNRTTLFPNKRNQPLNRDLKKIGALAKIELPLTFHLSRHSFASMMAYRKMNPLILSHVLGHSNTNMTLRYVNVDIEEVKEQMAASAIFKKCL